MRSGAFSLSSNRVDATGACGGRAWIIDPEGDVLAITAGSEPFATRDIDLTKAAKAKESYPRDVFRRSGSENGTGAAAAVSPEGSRTGR
jgi:N-carbamoylputrescine amidase